MKKLSVLALILVLALSFAIFTACEDLEYYEDLNAMLNLSYEKITLEVNSKGYAELNAKFDCTFDNDNTATIDYAYDKLAKFEVSGGSITAPENSVETISGTLQVKDGTIVGFDTDEWNIDMTTIKANRLNFASVHFNNEQKTDTVFTADVVDANGFMQSQMHCSRMTVSVEYINNQTFTEISNGSMSVKTGSVLSKIVITYFDTDTNSDITLTYKFLKAVL